MRGGRAPLDRVGMTARSRSRPAADPVPPESHGGAGTALLDETSRDDGEPPIHLIICDSQPIFAQGLLQLLATEAPDFEVSGIALSVEALLEMTSRLLPDLVMLDPRFRLDPLQPLFSLSPSVKVVLLASADLETDFASALAV